MLADSQVMDYETGNPGTGMDTYLEKYQIPAIDYTKGVRVENPMVSSEGIYPSKELLEAECDFSSKMKPTLWSELQEQ